MMKHTANILTGCRIFGSILLLCFPVFSAEFYIIYVFCSVVFSEGGKAYYYLSDNRNLRCGDHVIVPVGKYNEEKTGRIVKIEVYQGNTDPVPVDRLKYIIDRK